MKWKTSSKWRTTGQRLLSFLIAFAMLFPTLVIRSTAGATGPQPGANNPAQTYAKWPDDEIYLPTAVLSTNVFQMMAYNYMNGSQQAVQPYGSFPTASYHDAIATVAGRILTPEYDSLLYAYDTGVWGYNGGWGYDLSIDTWRAGALSHVYTIASGMDSRVNGGTEFVDMAAGDLDGMPTG
jgi:hypothetical protein